MQAANIARLAALQPGGTCLHIWAISDVGSRPNVPVCCIAYIMASHFFALLFFALLCFALLCFALIDAMCG